MPWICTGCVTVVIIQERERKRERLRKLVKELNGKRKKAPIGKNSIKLVHDGVEGKGENGGLNNLTRVFIY